MPEPVEHHDVIVIGAGPAGLFCADVLAEATDVVVVDQGKPMDRRVCPDNELCDCRPCDVLEGEGGAGSFSDGKIPLSPGRGTHGRTDVFSSDQALLLHTVEETIRRFSPTVVDHPVIAGYPDEQAGGLEMSSYPLIHVGSDGIRAFGRAYADHLRGRGVHIRMQHQVMSLLTDGTQTAGVHVWDRQARTHRRMLAPHVIVACGLAGTVWLERELTRLNVPLHTGPADIGIRLETTAQALAPFIDTFYDFKATHTSNGIGLRSFCVNAGGYVITEYHRALGIRGVNGHSYLNNRNTLSNLAIVATLTPDHHPDPKTYVRQLARQVNAAAHGYPLRQPLSDLMDGTSPPLGLTPTNIKTRQGDLAQALPRPVLEVFLSYIRAVGQALPPVLSADTMVYAPEIKYYGYRPCHDSQTWESTDMAGLYVIGNAAGHTASLSAAAVTGLIAGRAITQRLTGSADSATTPR